MPTLGIGEHKTDIGLTAAAAGGGALVGRALYDVVPSKMVRKVHVDGKTKDYVTNTFINYARKVSEKDLYSVINEHTERNWLLHQRDVIRKNASRAKAYPKGGERWQFQKIYDLGIKYMTERGEVAKEDIGLAKRGANAINYGRMIEKRNMILACSALFGLVALGIKKAVEKYQEYKESGAQFKSVIPTPDNKK